MTWPGNQLTRNTAPSESGSFYGPPQRRAGTLPCSSLGGDSRGAYPRTTPTTYSERSPNAGATALTSCASAKALAVAASTDDINAVSASCFSRESCTVVRGTVAPCFRRASRTSGDTCHAETSKPGRIVDSRNRVGSSPSVPGHVAVLEETSSACVRNIERPGLLCPEH